MNWATLWTAFTGSLSAVKAWSAQMRAILWFALVVAILVAMTVVLPRYDCRALNFEAACASVERGYK